MKKIKAVFIDWGFTFATIKSHKARNAARDKVLKTCGLTWKKFAPTWKNFYLLRSAGRIKSDRELEVIINRALQKKIPVKKFIEASLEEQIIPEEHINTVKELKKNYKVAVLSNNVDGWIKKISKKYKIENLFDALIISSKVGARKPDAIIYYESLKRLGVKASESVFIADEVAEDLVPATGLGMKTIWYKTDFKGWWNENDGEVLKIYAPDATVKNLSEIIPVINSWDID